eukprot:GSChrysophyteH1.ASY1.ANO1.1612.1 assembled CDS
MVGSNNKNLGINCNRNGGVRDSGYDITIEWQTLIVTGVATSTGSPLGTSTFYVNGVQVGTADRVGSGTQTYSIGHRDGHGPGYISVAGVLNQKLTTAEIKALHNRLAGTTSVSSCTICPTGKYSSAGNGQVCGCAAGSTGSWNGFASLISLIDARDAANAAITPTGSVGIPDLSGTPGMEWKKSWGSLSFTTEDNIPCWSLNAGTLVTSTRTTLGDRYTLFYYWKPRVSDTAPTGWRALHLGWLPSANVVKDY